MALTALQKARVANSASKNPTVIAANKAYNQSRIVRAPAGGETSAERFARTQRNVQAAAGHLSPGQKVSNISQNKGQIIKDGRVVADYGYGDQANANAARYIAERGRSIGSVARSEGATTGKTYYGSPASPTPAMKISNPIRWNSQEGSMSAPGYSDAAQGTTGATGGVYSGNMDATSPYSGARPILDGSTSQYQTTMPEAPKSLADIRADQLSQAQSAIDATQALFAEQQRQISATGASQLAQTSSNLVGAGLAGSPFAQTGEAGVQANTQNALNAISAQRSADISDAQQKAEANAQALYQQGIENYQVDRTFATQERDAKILADTKAAKDALEQTQSKFDQYLQTNIDPANVDETFLSSLDEAAGVPDGFYKNIYTSKYSDNATAKHNALVENAGKLVTVLEKIPVGETIKIDGTEYMSLQKGDVATGSEVDSSGNVTVWSLNKDTGGVKTYSMGNIGSPEGWQYVERNGVAGLVNTKTGDVKVLGDQNEPNFGHADGGILDAFPEGTISSIRRHTNQGSEAANIWMDAQCGSWVNDVTGIGAGDTWASKQAKMTNVLSKDSKERLNQAPNVGDVFTQTISTNNLGHIGIVNAVTPIYDKDNNVIDYQLTLSESNWKTTKDPEVLKANGIDPSILSNSKVAKRGVGLVTHTRTMKLSDAKLTGFASPGFKDPAYNFGGTDASSSEATAAMDTFLAPEEKAASVEDVTALRSKFVQEAGTYSTVRDAFSRVKVAADNPSAAGDLSLIFGYMKLLDPTSTVREGEQASAQNAAGIPDVIKNQYNKLMTGERLNTTQRADFLNQANLQYNIQYQNFKPILDNYTAEAGYLGVDPSRIIGTVYVPEISNDPKTPSDEVTPEKTTKAWGIFSNIFMK